ncbi:MAG: tail fiber protein [Capsulimonas sp.]|uniref:phage tail protein n=1 Tax=Capsulimonas sp. TaxID=2494211 RepID=UPI003264A274
MSEPYIGEIRMVGFSFAPNGWALCNGSTLAISQNDALFNLIGTTYGGDGVQTFNLPNLLGRTPIHFSSNIPLGAIAGSETVTLISAQLPPHSHPLRAMNGPASTTTATGVLLASASVNVYTPPTSVVATTTVTTATGGGQPHDNMAPYLCVNFAISLFGVYPSQN